MAIMPLQKPGSKNVDGAGYGNILNFFKPAAHSRPQTPNRPRTPPQALRGSATASTPLSSPPPSSRLGRTTTPVRQAASEIPASDDDKSDGGYSDDSLEDISALLGRRQPPIPLTPQQRSQQRPQQRPQHNPYATPRAKRTEVHFHSSPLAFIPRHKFDIKALAKDARLDDATTASSMRARAGADETERNAKSPSSKASGDAFMEIVKERGGQDAQKVLRAVQRSEPGHSHQRYCFFDPDYRCPPSTTAPRDAGSGPWRLLTQGSMKLRAQHLASGVLQTAIRKMKNLPDSLLDWILDEVCIQRSTLMRYEYCSIAADCPEQIARLVTPQRLQELFVRLGAHESWEGEGSKLAMSNLEQEPYLDRDWACLKSFLWLLGTMSQHLSVSAVQFATHTLLRMSMDSFLVCNVDLLMEHGDAVQSLAEAIPNSSWDSFVSLAPAEPVPNPP